ncbi:MAG: hypothetical protein AAF747_10905 [Planctomycetota bacterium]
MQGIGFQASVSVSLIAAVAASGQIIDFEVAPPPTAGFNGFRTTSYSEDGFTLQGEFTDGLTISASTDTNGFAGSRGLYSQFQNQTITLTKDDGGNFDILSVDLAEINTSSPAFTIAISEFRGFRDGVEVASVTFAPLNDGSTFATYVFPSTFINLGAVEFGAVFGGNGYQLDNITLGPPTPAPAAALVLAGGALASSRRRR